MALVKAQCTNCNGYLEVDNTKDAAVCPYCNTPYIIEKAIKNYITNGTTNYITNNYIQGGSAQSADIAEFEYNKKRGIELLEQGRWDEAYKYLREIPERYVYENPEIEFYLMKAHTHNFSKNYKYDKEEAWAKSYYDDISSLESRRGYIRDHILSHLYWEKDYVLKAFDFIPNDGKYASYRVQVDSYIKHIEKKITELENEKNAVERMEKEKEEKKYRKRMILKGIFIVAIVTCFIYTFISFVTTKISGIFIGIIFLLIFIYNYRRNF